MIVVSQNRDVIITDAEVKSAFCYVVSETDAKDNDDKPIKVNVYEFFHKFFMDNEEAVTKMGTVRNIERAQYIQNRYLDVLIGQTNCPIFQFPTDEHMQPNNGELIDHWDDYEVIIEEQEQQPLQLVYGENTTISKAGDPMTWKV